MMEVESMPNRFDKTPGKSFKPIRKPPRKPPSFNAPLSNAPPSNVGAPTRPGGPWINPESGNQVKKAQSEVDTLHKDDDLDEDAKAHHHTLGPGPTQAATGDHSHAPLGTVYHQATVAASGLLATFNANNTLAGIKRYRVVATPLLSNTLTTGTVVFSLKLNGVLVNGPVGPQLFSFTFNAGATGFAMPVNFEWEVQVPGNTDASITVEATGGSYQILGAQHISFKLMPR